MTDRKYIVYADEEQAIHEILLEEVKELFPEVIEPSLPRIFNELDRWEEDEDPSEVNRADPCDRKDVVSCFFDWKEGATPAPSSGFGITISVKENNAAQTYLDTEEICSRIMAIAKNFIAERRACAA